MDFNALDHIKSSDLLDVIARYWWDKNLSKPEKKVLEAVMVASFAHPGAASMVHTQEVAQLTGSLQQSLIAGIATIGKIHGAATKPAAKLLQTDERHPREIVTEMIGQSKKIPGLGHRVYQDDDPRTQALFEFAAQQNVANEYIDKMQSIRLQFSKQKKHLCINIDGAIAAILSDIGVPWQKVDMVFLWPRIAGLAAAYYNQNELKLPNRLR